MEEENKQQDQNQEQNVDNKDVKKEENKSPESIPYNKFKETNEKMQEYKRKYEAIEAEKRKLDEDKLKEEGKFKDLLDKREKELADLRLEKMRSDVAIKKGVPANWIKRIQGATLEELEQDADEIVANLKGSDNNSNNNKKEEDNSNKDKKQVFNKQNNNSNVEKTDINEMTDEEILKAIDEKRFVLGSGVFKK